MSNQDPDATDRQIPVEREKAQPSLPPPSVITDTGEHPAIVLKPETRGQFAAGLIIDGLIVVCVTFLIYTDKITATEGLPWIALLAGVKARQASKGRSSGVGGSILSILGITKGPLS